MFVSVLIEPGSLDSGKYLVDILSRYGFTKIQRSLGGMNGDIAGYALTIAELSGAAVLAMGGMV